MMTRMNVIFSRPQKRMLIINPIQGKNAFSTLYSDERKLITFGMSGAPSFVKTRPKESRLITISRKQKEYDELSDLMFDTYQLIILAKKIKKLGIHGIIKVN